MCRTLTLKMSAEIGDFNTASTICVCSMYVTYIGTYPEALRCLDPRGDGRVTEGKTSSPPVPAEMSTGILPHQVVPRCHLTILELIN